MSLGEVLGHERPRSALVRALERGRLPPALLFAGPDGVGKRTVAVATARAALCERGGGEACSSCGTCRRIDSGLRSLDELRRAADRHPDEDLRRNLRPHPDLMLVEGWRLTRGGRPRPEPEIRVEQVRDLITEIAGAPFEARRRVFVVDDAHAMNEAAQNALLKSLEEPPPRSHIVLVTASPLGLRPTIRSRCQTLRFGPLSREDVVAQLQGRWGLASGEARAWAGLAGGSLGVALALDSAAFRDARDELVSLLERVGGMGAGERLERAERLERLEDPQLVLATLRSLLRDLAVLRAGGRQAALVHGDLAERLAGIAASPLGPHALALADRVEEARRALRGFGNRLLAFDVLVDALAVGPSLPASRAL